MVKKAATTPTIPPLTEDLLNDVQVMQRLGVKRTKLHKLMREEGFPYLKFGRSLRFDPRKIAEWLEERSA